MKTVLYVDDESMNLDLFRINFRSDFHVITALTGREGLVKKAQHPEISAVFSDMKMPEMNGMEFIRQVKSMDPGIPCFLVSGYDYSGEISEAMNSRLIEEYFQKPLDFKKIRQCILDLLHDGESKDI